MMSKITFRECLGFLKMAWFYENNVSFFIGELMIILGHEGYV